MPPVPKIGGCASDPASGPQGDASCCSPREASVVLPERTPGSDPDRAELARWNVAALQEVIGSAHRFADGARAMPGHPGAYPPRARQPDHRPARYCGCSCLIRRSECDGSRYCARGRQAPLGDARHVLHVLFVLLSDCPRRKNSSFTRRSICRLLYPRSLSDAPHSKHDPPNEAAPPDVFSRVIAASQRRRDGISPGVARRLERLRRWFNRRRVRRGDAAAGQLGPPRGRRSHPRLWGPEVSLEPRTRSDTRGRISRHRKL